MATKEKTELPDLPEEMVALAPHLTGDLDVLTEGMSAEEREDYIKEIHRIHENRKVTFGTYSQKLALIERPGYKRHWFNEKPGRIEDALSNGWAHVKDKSKKEVKRVVGSNRQGGPLYAYAMEIPMPFWIADMRRRHQQARDRMDQIRQNPISAPAGVAQRSDAGAFYNPNPGKEVLSIRETVAIERRPEKTG